MAMDKKTATKLRRLYTKGEKVFDKMGDLLDEIETLVVEAEEADDADCK